MLPTDPARDIQELASEPKAALVIVHGLAEYAGRYRGIAKELASRGVSTFAYDQIGHGAGAATRTHLTQFDLLVDDASAACHKFRERTGGIPLFVWGHSMGAIVALHLAAREEFGLTGLLVSSNSLDVFKRGPDPLHPFFRFAARIAPKMRVPLGLDVDKISADEAVQRAYATDPLIPRTASLRLIVEFAQACEDAHRDVANIRVPVLILHGEADAIAPATGSQVLWRLIGSTDKTLQIFPGLRHEIHNERLADRAAFLDLVSRWILAHAGHPTSSIVEGKSPR